MRYGVIDFQKRRGRVHVQVRDHNGIVHTCGVIPADYLAQLALVGDYDATLSLRPVDLCDHGGTYRDPRPWGAEPEPSPGANLTHWVPDIVSAPITACGIDVDQAAVRGQGVAWSRFRLTRGQPHTCQTCRTAAEGADS